jgi:hypothetical protein
MAARDLGLVLNCWARNYEREKDQHHPTATALAKRLAEEWDWAEALRALHKMEIPGGDL